MKRELNQRDDNFAIPVDEPTDRRNQTEAGRLRRAAYAARFAGYTSLALLYENAAFVAEQGCSWLTYIHREGRAMAEETTDDVQLKESIRGKRI